jgi:tagatose 1,6-diphosphate aldolase
VDGELSLVSPSVRYLDEFVEAEAVVAASGGVGMEGGAGAFDLEYVRERQEEFLRACPRGHQRSHSPGKVPTYHFWMRVDHRHPGASGIPMRIVGGINLRVGNNPELELYTGHIGYHVHEPARGRHYAERACRLLLPLARRHRLSPLIITCNPDNIPSRRTCERLGAAYVDRVNLPLNHSFRERGETQKCRYRLVI